MASATSTSHIRAIAEANHDAVGGVGRDGPAQPPAGLRLETVTIDGERWCLLSHALEASCSDPSASLPSIPIAPELPPAMRAVAILAMQGLDNAAIARARGTSTRTVAKQLEVIYRRLAIGSRIELLTRFGPVPARPAAKDGT